jgi:hypothetical protein
LRQFLRLVSQLMLQSEVNSIQFNFLPHQRKAQQALNLTTNLKKFRTPNFAPEMRSLLEATLSPA